jgi:hypothetical protein
MPKTKTDKIDPSATHVVHRMLFGGVLNDFSFTFSKLLDSLDGESNEPPEAILARLRQMHTVIGEQLTKLEDLISHE